jgi:hypothetical protein
VVIRGIRLGFESIAQIAPQMTVSGTATALL